MMKGSGQCRISGVEVGEMQVDFFRPTPLLTAKYAFVDASSEMVPVRLGSNHRNRWSEEVMKRLAHLREALEAEIVGDLFEGGVTTDGAAKDEKPQEDQIDSL